MGFDCTYQGLPSDASVISKARADANFAENVFYSVVAYSNKLEGKHYFNEKEYSLVRELFKLHPEVRNWNYSPSSRMQQAVMYCLNPSAIANANSFEVLSSTFEYRFVRGNEKFDINANSGEIQLVRYSSPAFVSKCAEYAEKISYKYLLENFDPKKMTELHIYKISEFSEFEYIYEYFLGLKKLYVELASLENVSIFITEQ
jgi:hypothetical protein